MAGDYLQHFLARQRLSPVTSDSLGGALHATPFDLDHNEYGVALGRGQPLFERARAALGDWCLLKQAGLEIMPNCRPVHPDNTVALVARCGPLSLVAACRVVEMIDEERRFGFALGTLPSHPYPGEYGFVVERRETGVVCLMITSVWQRPEAVLRLAGMIPALVAKRRLQRCVNDFRRSVDGSWC